MNKRLVSIICAAALFTQTLPTNAIATTIEDAFIKKGLNSEVDKDKSDSNSEESSSKDENETSQDNKLKEEELGLDKVKFNAYIDKTDQLLFSIGFDEKEKKFTVSEQSEKNISEETPEETMYTIKIFDKEQKEKFSVELKGKDTGNSEKLEPLKSLNYEVGDFIQITPTDSKDVLKITGNIQGDVDKQKEDYSDGIDNYDYIGNVRFQVEEDHLKTVYNEAPVINGLTDIEESENPMNDILTGISIKDDHDGDIDNSKIVPLITELEGGVLEVSYTVEDSWGRKATGKRKISPKKVEQEEVKQEEPKIIREEINLRTGSSSSSDSQTATGLAANIITVEGTPYYGSQIARFEIRFDTIANQIQIANEDGRKLSNSVDGEYFKFVLYDKDMNVKTSVTLLGSDKSDSDKLDAINNYLFEEGDYIGIWHAETKNGTDDESVPENNPSSPSFIPKLKIDGQINVLSKNASGDLTESGQTKNYSNGMDNQEISSRRFRITKSGLKEVTNQAPQIKSLNDVTIARGGEFDPLKEIKNNKITDDFDKFTEDNLDARVVSISHSDFNNSKVGTQTITYTVTDSWGKSSTAQMNLIVTSSNPIDEKYIELKDGDKSLFKIKFDSVEHKFLVDNLENIVDKPIDSSVSSSIFKLKVYTKGGVLQKTLNIKGTDNLKSVLKKFDGYEYTVGDRIEVWSNNPKNIIIHGVDRDENKVPEQKPSETPTEPSDGNTEQQPDGGSSETPENGEGEQALELTTRAGNTNQAESYQENYEDGIDDSDYMKNVRFEIQSTKLKYIYNKAPEFIIQDNIKLEINRSGVLSKDDLMNGLTVDDDHDGGNLTKKVIVGELDTSTIGEKEVEYRVIDSWGRSSLIKRKVTVYPYNNLEYNYINVKNNETGESILKIRFDDINKKFVVDKVDKSKIPSSLNNDNKVFEIKLIKKEDINSRSNEDNVKVKTISLTKKELIDGDKVNEINNLSYKEFNYISLWVYDSKEGISISKKPNLTSNDQLLKSGVSEEGSLDGILLNGFENQEKMQNTRFEIKSEGLEKIYNEGPVINGLDDILYVYKNDNIQKNYALKGVSVSSDIDKTIPNEKIVITNLNNENLENLDDEINKVGKFTLKYTVTDSWGKSATYNRTVSVISKSVSNDIEFYNENGSKNLFSLKYNPISNIFDVSKKENSQPSQGEQEPSESEDPSEQPPQGTDSSNGEQVQAKTGDAENRNDIVQTPPSINGEEGSSSGTSRPEEGATPPEQDSTTQTPDNSQGGQQPEGTGGSNNQQTKDEIVFKLTVFNGKEEKVGELELTEEKAKNTENLKKELEKITIYDDYYVALWSNTPQRIKIKGDINNEELNNIENSNNINYSNGVSNKDFIENVRFHFTEDGIHTIYNKAPEIIVKSKEILTAYAGDLIDYTKNIQVVDDRDNPTGDHIIDNSKIKVTIVPKETNSGGTQTDSNGSASGSGSSNTEGNGDSDGTDRNPGSESGDTSSSEDIGSQGQTTENEEAAFVNDESLSETTGSSDKDNSNKTEEEKFLEEQKNHLKIGKNKIKLTVADSWGRTTTIERNLLILNGIDKNEIIFKSGSRQEPIRIKFNHQTKKLNITTQNVKFSNTSNPDYVKIAVYRPNENGGREPIVPEIRINASDTVTDGTLQTLKNYEFKYGDYFEIYHGHPQLFSITGGINDQREDYTDGVQNPENLLNVKFEITKSGLKSIYTNPDESNIIDNKVVFGPVAQEKFPFKIQIDFTNKKFKVIDVTGTNIEYGNSNVVYKMALIRKNIDGTTSIVRKNDFQGTDFGKQIMDTRNENSNFNNRNKNWNGQRFEYNDCLYLWHNEPNRSIIKGNIKKEREDYSNGVDDPDNMNNVVFRLTPNGLESIYNNAPEIKGANNIDVYQNESFNVSEGIKYNDDYDADHLTKSVSLKENGMIRTVANTNNNNNGLNWNLDTSKLGEKILIYTATDRWGKTTTVERKVTVRPNLYKNVFKVYAESDNTIDDTSSKGISENLADGDSIGEISTPETTPLPNIPQQPSTDDSISNGNNAEDNKPEVDKRKLAFEIGFDTVNNKYKVYNQTNEKLSNNNTDETAFAIQIKSSTGQEKAKIILTGNKRGTAPELLELNNIEYADDDIIRIYRSTLSGIEITGDVTGDIPRKNDDMNETNKFDYMKNTGFKVRNAGLNAKYNKAPVINGVKNNRTVSKGTVNLLEGITVSDDIDNISTNNIYIYIDDKFIGNVDNNNNSQLYTNYNFDEVRTYNIEYKLYDSWNRETIERSTVKVESKVRENEIEVYGPNQQLAFRITFDTNENKFILKGQDNSQNVSKENENIESYSSELNEDNYFQMIVRDARGNEKKKVILTGEVAHDSQQLSELHQFEFNKYDTISLKAKTAQAVKIKGNILPEVSTKSTITDYSNGFDTVEKYSEVRFKITDDGLREMTKKSLRINGADPIAIKRGDTLDLLDGISVGLDDENNDDYKITVKEISSNGNNVVLLDDTDSDDSTDDGTTDKDEKLFKKLKEGVYTVRYTVTNSWGATTIANRQITVQPRTELEAVKLTIKDYQGDNILIIGFDSIEKKLRVIEYKKKSINYLDSSQVFEINAFDSLGKTIGTIALKGDQTINEEIINRINAFSYEEGYSLSVWSKELENRINIEGTIKVDNNSTEESKKSIYKTSLSLDDKKDKMENGRFEILSDGLKYIYNNAPTITGGEQTIPYYKGSLLSIPSDLNVEDDHDNISSSEVTIDDDQVDYDKLGLQNITYVVEDSWGRRGTKPGKIEIRSSMDSNSIDIYPKENSTTSGTTSEGIQQPNPNPEDTTQGESPQTRTTEIESDSGSIENGNTSEGTNPNPEAGGTVTDGITQAPEGGNNTSGSASDGPTTPDNETVKNSGFSIKFVREGDKNRIKVELGTKKDEKFDSNNSEQTFLTIKIYDVDGTELKSIEILGSDTGTSAKEKIEAALKNSNKDNGENPDQEDEVEEEAQINTDSDSGKDDQEDTDDESSQGGSNLNNNEFEYFNGQYIAIEGVTEATKSSVKIQGTIVNKQIEYNTGISDLDKIKNVRFKFSDLGLEAVYNNAPVIKINENIKLDGTERKTNSNIGGDSSQRTEISNEEDADGTKGDTFNYLRGVTLSDDHDTLTKENIEVKWNDKFIGDLSNYEIIEKNALSESTEQEPTSIENGIKVYGQQQVGENILYYKVTDSWGRVTFAQRKNIKLKNGAFEDNIKFGNGNYGDDKLSLKFNKVTNDTEEKVQLQLTANDNNNYFASNDADFEYYKIEVWVPDNTLSNNRTNGYSRLKNLVFRGNQKPQDVQNEINSFNELKVPYGTILKIYSGHPQLFSIDGPIRNGKEDYSDKVQNPENLVNTVFKITNEGLRAIYVTPRTDSINDNENLISLVAPEKIPLKIKISPNGSAGNSSNGGRISIVDSNTTWIDGSVEGVVFTMILKSADGRIKKNISINGKNYGNDNAVRDQFNNFNYEFGDTLTITHLTPKKVLIKGNVKGAREDYSDGVDNSLNLTEAVFKLTETSMEVTYKSAPKIMGILDMEVIKGGTINYEKLKSSVTAKDNIDGTIEDIEYLDDDSINTDKVGMYEYRYQVTNSNNRTTTKSSTITVYDLPEIEKNNKATIELNSIDDSEEAIEDYLKTAVDVSDDDDKLYGKETKLELISNDVKPSKEGVYKARYKATDLYGHSKEETINIQVVRTINVTVPTKLPFQVVTNLMPDENGNIENNGFVSGVLKLKNNNTSPVKVSVESFGKKANSGKLEIVYPESCDWEKMTEEDSMTKMALGLYIKDNSLTESEYNTENPLWLSTNKQNGDDIANPDSPEESEDPSSRTGTTEDSSGDKVNVINKELGKLPAKETGSDKPKEASIGFTSKHGKNFIGGSVTGKFELIFKFE